MSRVKINSGTAVYHCISRTVNGERLFDDVAKEVLRKQLWQVADFCGVEIITYALLSNHFHVLVRVPEKGEVADSELLRRFARLYPKPTKFQTARLEVIQSQLATDGPEAVAWRRRQSVQMGDVSAFMKLLKQRFSIWYNRTHQRFGTLWAERFKSVLIEPKGHAALTVAAYIDLNPVRAGLANDPKDYRFCGYAEAIAGHSLAQSGLESVIEGRGWAVVQARYRELLFGTGSSARPGAFVVTNQQFEDVVAAGGHLPLATILRHRVRYFSDGVVLGSKAFVASHLKNRRSPRTLQPRPLAAVTDWGGLTTARGLRKGLFG